jgi:Dynein attachment factor N-terminus
MDRITEKEIKQLTEECLNKVKSDNLYMIRNEAKLRAVNSTKSYDEFKWVKYKKFNFLFCLCMHTIY